MAAIRGQRKQWVMVFGDTLLMFVALFAALLIRRLEQPTMADFSLHIMYFVAVFFSWIIIFFINGLYDIMKARNTSMFFTTFIESLVVGFLTASLYFYLLPRPAIEPRTLLLIFVGVYGGLFVMWRSALHKYIASRSLAKRVLFIGAQSEAYELIDALKSHPQFGYEVYGMLEPDGNVPRSEMTTITWLTDISQLKPFVKEKKISTIVVSSLHTNKEEVAHELFDTMFWGIEVTDVVSFYETILGRIPVTALTDAWFLENVQEAQKRHYDSFKIVLDYVLGFFGIILGGLLTPFIAAAIYIEDKGPIFYSQTRVGKRGVEFLMFKFRTMGMDAEKNGAQFAENNDPRITRVGRILRKTRLDELPQLYNILKGDMTFIGPRPERPEFVKHFAEVIPFYEVRTLVKPGLTGWASINYPYYATVGENVKKLQYDLYYIKNRSLFLDIRIVLKTINTVLRWMGV